MNFSSVVNTETEAIHYLYTGIFVLACYAVIHYFSYLRLREAGYQKHIFNFMLVEAPIDYLKLRRKYGWSP